MPLRKNSATLDGSPFPLLRITHVINGVLRKDDRAVMASALTLPLQTPSLLCFSLQGVYTASLNQEIWNTQPNPQSSEVTSNQNRGD